MDRRKAASCYYHPLSHKKEERTFLLNQKLAATERTIWCLPPFAGRAGVGRASRIEFVFENLSNAEEILMLVGPTIEKQETVMRANLPAKESLAVTLRFLATGK